MSFIAELRRRSVFRVGFVYAVTAWLLMQITDVVSPILGLPEWAPALVLVILAVGFVPALIFAWAFELTPDGIQRESGGAESAPTAMGRKLDFAVIAILVAGVAFLLFDRFSADSADTGLTIGDKSIAVLPFVNMSSDEEQEYFSDGITEEILNALASVKELHVTGRTSSFAFKGQNDDLRRIGRTLGVAHILEGSVRKSGDTVRITAQLIQVDSGFHMWSAAYDRELNDIFAIQDEIAEEILVQLKAHLLDGERESLIRSRTDPEVYELFLLARQRIYSRHPVQLKDAINLLKTAIDQDPNYAPAYGLLAIALMLGSEGSYGDIPRAEALHDSKASIDKGLELDDSQAEVWAALGFYLGFDNTYSIEAIDALERARTINPNMIDAANWLATQHQLGGNISAAWGISDELIERDPLFRPVVANGSMVLAKRAQFDAADALIENYRNIAGDDWLAQMSAAQLSYLKGAVAAGITILEELYRESGGSDFVMAEWQFGLVLTMQVDELMTDEAVPRLRVEALDMSGRRAEALQLGLNLAEEGYSADLFRVLNRAGRSSEVVVYFNEHWADSDSYVKERAADDGQYSVMGPVVQAFAREGDVDRFDAALIAYDKYLRMYLDAGADNYLLSREQAMYHALAGDTDKALERLEHAVDQGIIGAVPLALAFPEFESIKDHPRFLAAEARLLGRINTERAALDLLPVSIDNEFWPQDRL